MHAKTGDKLVIHGNVVGQGDREGEIIEVRGPEGAPPYVVRFPDGHEQFVFPGPDAVIVPAERQD
ncbi:DUF1918 domain-containing protein [Nonomuraea fastidiosa]|jgi:hypothetical protein|uniref:DUF1918 domain-containing protein n=1 Tax=Nonomuraea TaxID=83681 RepID=UPI00324CF60C